jgi:Tfp pilus assembly protein PilO
MTERVRILAIVALVLFAFVLSDYLGSATEALRQQALQTQGKLSRYMGLYERRESLKEISQKAETQFRETQKRLLEFSEPSEGFIILQQQIKDAIEDTGLGIRSITPMDIHKEKEITVLPVRLTVEGSMSELGQFFNRLYSNGLLFGVKSIQITRGRADGYIRAQITVEGYGRLEESS